MRVREEVKRGESAWGGLERRIRGRVSWRRERCVTDERWVWLELLFRELGGVLLNRVFNEY